MASFALLATPTALQPLSPSTGTKNVVFTLVHGDDDLSVFKERQACLSRALAGSERYDSVAFHDGNLPAALMQSFEDSVSFVNVHDTFVAPSHVEVPEAVVTGEVEGSLNYRRMCQLMSFEWFGALANYDYAMRVDEDVCVQKFGAGDPFKAMRERNLVYGYGLKTVESHYETVRTMPPWVRAYAAREGLTPPEASPTDLVRAGLPQLPGQSIYFTNFFVSRVDWWKRPDVQKFLQAVNVSGNVFTQRWGDAPIQTSALALFAPKAAVERLPTSYLHISTMDKIHGDGSRSDGWEDVEMVRHPIARAYHRRLNGVSSAGNATDCNGTAGSNSSNSSACAPVVMMAHYVELAFDSAGSVGAATLTEVAALYASWAGVDAALVSATAAAATPQIDVRIRYPTAEEAQAGALAAVAQLQTASQTSAFLSSTGVVAANDATIGTVSQDLPPPSPPPPSVPPSPPPPPPPSVPPAAPPKIYTPSSEESSDVSPGLVMGVTAGGIAAVALLALGFLFATKHRAPLECGPVPKAKLGAGMLRWGFFSARYRYYLAGCMLAVYISIAAVGLPRVEMDQGSPTEWVPKGSRLQSRIEDWERLVDDSVTDRTHAYIMISSDDGDNLLEDPLRWLDATLNVVRRVYDSATVETEDRDGNDLELGWKDFCFSINHPMLVDPIPPFSDGTQGKWKPCINPSVLDVFLEQTWEFNRSDINNTVAQEKADSFDVINNVGNVACAVSPPNCGQVNNPFSYDSMYQLSKSEIIRRLMENSHTKGHWIAAGSQPWGKLYGKFETGVLTDSPTPSPTSSPTSSLTGSASPTASPTASPSASPTASPSASPTGNVTRLPTDAPTAAPTSGDLVYAKSFVYTLYQDIPKEVVKFRKSVQNMTADTFRDANKAWLKKLEDRLQELDADEDSFPGVRVTYFPSDALDRMYKEVASAQTTTIIIGYSVMLVFVCLSQLSFERYKNIALLGFLGFLFVLAGNAAAYGLIALAGYKYNSTMVQALPFLALGLGVDDLFLLLHAYKGVMKHFRGQRRGLVVALTLMEAGSSVTITSFCNACVFFAGYMIPIEALQAFSIAAGTIVCFNWLTAMTLVPLILAAWTDRFAKTGAAPVDVRQAIVQLEHARRGGTASAQPAAGEKRDPWWTPEQLAVRFYTHFSTSTPLKLLFLAIGVGLLAGFAALIPSVEIGIKETDLAKKGSYLAKGINDVYADIFSQHSTEYVVFGVGVDYRYDQKVLLDTHQALKSSKWSAYGTEFGRGGTNENTWLENMYQSQGVCPHWNVYNDSTDPSWAFYEDLHLWRKPQTFLNPRQPGTLAFGSLFAGLLDRANQWPYANGADNYDTNNTLLLSWDEVELNMNKLQSSDNKIQMIKDFKDITDESGANVYMYGWLFIQYEQLLELDTYFWHAVAVSMAVVFVIALAFGMSWLNAALVAFFSIALCVEVYGSLKVWDIYYQTLAATSMLMSIGIAVEFVAHPVAAYEFAVGSRDERLAAAMSMTALPVAEGALSSFLGFCFLAASDFEFVTKYFFDIFLMICAFGTINALVFLPAILGLFGASKREDEDDFRKAAASVSDRGEQSPRSPKASSGIAWQTVGQLGLKASNGMGTPAALTPSRVAPGLVAAPDLATPVHSDGEASDSEDSSAAPSSSAPAVVAIKVEEATHRTPKPLKLEGSNPSSKSLNISTV